MSDLKSKDYAKEFREKKIRVDIEIPGNVVFSKKNGFHTENSIWWSGKKIPETYYGNWFFIVLLWRRELSFQKLFQNLFFMKYTIMSRV